MSGRLRAVYINTRNIFDKESARRQPLEALLNALHVTTRGKVVDIEMWFRPGDTVDTAMAEELERNLRALGIFAEVRATLVPTGTEGEYDLHVVTRDRLSIVFGAGASYVGGVGGVRASIGESNLLGLGDRVSLSFNRNTDDEYRGSLSYTDLHVLDTWHTATVTLSRTDEGDSIDFGVRRPFKHLVDPFAYGVRTLHAETRVDYFRDGDTAAEVPQVENRVILDGAWGDGPRDRRRRLGLLLDAREREYGAARGQLAPAIDVPGTTRTVYFGPFASWQRITGFRKAEGLDTLQFVQDIVLGTEIAVGAGVLWRDEQGSPEEWQPELSASAGWAAEPLPDLLTNTIGRGRARIGSGSLVGWEVSALGQAYLLLAEQHTLAVNVSFDAVEETQDLPVELTLGGDNGLRGYRARQFSGTRRLRANVEHRYDTGLEFATLRFGAVAFADAGWVGRGSDLGHPYTAAGLGLRVGSPRLFGSSVLRIDLALPFNDAPGSSGGLQISVTAGQVFTFGGTPAPPTVR